MGAKCCKRNSSLDKINNMCLKCHKYHNASMVYCLQCGECRSQVSHCSLCEIHHDVVYRTHYCCICKTCVKSSSNHVFTHPRHLNHRIVDLRYSN